MGAAALQKYIGSLGGIGTSGVGSSSSYAPKELNKEVMPEKVILELCIVSSNADRSIGTKCMLKQDYIYLSNCCVNKSPAIYLATQQVRKLTH